MKVKTDELRSAFKVTDCVPISEVLESSQYLKIRQDGDKLILSMTGIVQTEASVKGQSQGGKWTAYIDRKIFKTFISTASEPETELFYKDKLTLKSGQRLELALHSQISGYESWAPKSSFDLTDEQRSFLKMAAKYLPTTAGTESCEAVCFDKDRILVTDTIYMIEIKGSIVKTNFKMPPEIVKFLNGTSEKVVVERTGVGLALSNGFLYQSLSSNLDNYPFDACVNVLTIGSKATTILKFKADEFAEALKIACQFTPDKTSAVAIETKDKSIIMTTVTNTGKFQRSVKATGTLTDSVNLRAHKLIPWLEYATDNEIEYSRIDLNKASASVFTFTNNKCENTLVIADL